MPRPEKTKKFLSGQGIVLSVLFCLKAAYGAGVRSEHSREAAV